MTKKQLTRTLLSFGLCGSLLMACTKKDNADAERAELNSATQGQKSKTAEMELTNSKLEAERASLAKQIEENIDLRAQLDNEVQAWADQRNDREMELFKMSDKVSMANLNLMQTTAKLSAVSKDLKSQSQLLEETKQSIIAEKAALEANIAQVKVQLAAAKATNDAAIAKDKAESDSGIAADKAALQIELDDLSLKLATVVAREKRNAVRATKNALMKKSLEDGLAELAQLQKDHEKTVQEFAGKVATARDFFIKNKKGDVFNKIEKNGIFTFRMALWGFGSVENIQMVQKKIAEYNKSKGLEKDNKNVRNYPNLVEGEQRRVLDQKNALKAAKVAIIKTFESVMDLTESNFYYKTGKKLRLLMTHS